MNFIWTILSSESKNPNFDMLDDQENIFNVPHTLPSSTHPVALATRTPTSLVKADASKLMPDYGGLLEVPGTRSKQYCLRKGIPFHIRPYCAQIMGTGVEEVRKESEDSVNLVVASYLEEQREPTCHSPISVIRAVGSTLYLNALRTIPEQHSEVLESSTYAHVPYPHQISGLKYCDRIGSFLIVKFEQGVKLLRLNEAFQISSYESPESSDTEEDEPKIGRVSISNEMALDFIGSFPELRGLRFGDACLTSSQRTVAMTSSDTRNIYIKLYDVSNSKKYYKTIIKARDDNAQVMTRRARQSLPDGTRLPRSFVPIRQPYESMQQLENDPHHLIHLTLTTSNRVSLVDIRSNSIYHDYVDRFKLVSALPTEHFNQVVFSRANGQQFYLLSNERIRVFDKRFLSQPMLSMEHMLDSSYHDVMKMKLIGHQEDDIETLCISTYGRLCFMSLDRGGLAHSLLDNSGELLNPRSLHLPLHEPSPAEVLGEVKNELHGLDVTTSKLFSNDRMAFSVIQLCHEGHIYVRGFERPPEDDQTLKTPSQASLSVRRIKSRKLQMDEPASRSFKLVELSEAGNGRRRRRSESPERESDEEDEDVFLDALDTSFIIDAEDKLTSDKAREKMELRKRLYKR